MATSSGTLALADLLAVETQSVLEYGIEPITAAIERELAIHNAIMIEMVAEMAIITTDREGTYGHEGGGEMTELDSDGRPLTTKVKGFSAVHFPMRKFGNALGWNADWFKLHSPADMARQVVNMETLHVKAIQTRLKTALMLATNYTFNDFLTGDDYGLAVKRLVNADGATIPMGPNGETFDGSTHTHYDAIDWGAASASAKNAAILALITDVIEHGHGTGVKIFINTAQETAIEALTSFTAYPDPRITYRATDTPSTTIDITSVDNRPIGFIGAAEVWTKSWMPANYVLCLAVGDARKPLKMRQRDATALQGLRLRAQNAAYPLYADIYEAEFDFGVYWRTNGAVLYLGAGTWADPSF